MTRSREFDWSADGENAAEIIIRGFGSIAVYTNPHNAVVIRQEDDYDPGDDHYIFLSRAQCPALALAILREAGIVMDRPLKPQLAEIMAMPFDMKRAEQFFKELSDELTDGDGTEGPIRPAVARMMAMRPDIDWLAVLQDPEIAGLSDEPPRDEPAEPVTADCGEQEDLPLIAAE